MAGDEPNAQAVYNCDVCRNHDGWKIQRKCPMPMKEPDKHEPIEPGNCTCPMYGLTLNDSLAIRLANLIDAGVVSPLDECDAWYFEAAEHIRNERARLTSEKMKAK